MHFVIAQHLLMKKPFNAFYDYYSNFFDWLPMCGRIRKSGGFVTWNSLGQPHVNGRLAMTRSIGDFDLKNAGVIAEPETKRISVSEIYCRNRLMMKCISWSACLTERLYCSVQLHHVHDAFLALTTDGINFIMNSQEICDVINQCHDPKEAAQRLSEQVRAWGQREESVFTALSVHLMHYFSLEPNLVCDCSCHEKPRKTFTDVTSDRLLNRVRCIYHFRVTFTISVVNGRFNHAFIHSKCFILVMKTGV